MDTLNSCAGLIATSLWSVSWQVTILVGIIWIVDRLSRRASSLFRYWLWCIVLLRLCVPVNLSLFSNINLRIRQFLYTFMPAMGEQSSRDVVSGIVQSITTPPFIHAEQSYSGEIMELTALTPKTPISTILCLLWFIVAVAIGILIIWMAFRTYKQMKQCPLIQRQELTDLLKKLCADMGITRPVQLRNITNKILNEPAVIGVFRPIIFLPKRIIDKWELCDIEPILLHELTHIKRFDLFVNWLQVIVQVVYFFHPFVWIVNRRLRTLREEVCDDMAIGLLDSKRKHYTQSLLNAVEETVKRPAIGFAAIGFSETGSAIGRRVRRIMSKKYRLNQKLTVFSVTALMIIGIISIILSCEQSHLKGNKNETDNDVSKNSSFNDFTLSDQQLLHIKHALGNPEYPEKYTFNVRVAAARGKQLQQSGEMISGIRNVVEAVDQYTYIETKFDENVSLNSPALFDYQIVYISSDRAFELTEIERKNFGTYLRNGGFAVVDNGEPTVEFGQAEASLRQMLRDALGADAKFLPIENDHPLYHSFFDFDYGPPQGAEIGMVQTSESRTASTIAKNTKIAKAVHYLEGIWLENRLVAIYSDKGYELKWNEKSEPQLKFGVNMVVYGFIQQNHVIWEEFLSKSLPEIKIVDIDVTILEDGDFEVDGEYMPSADLENVLKKKIGNGMSDYIYAKVHITTTPESPKIFNDVMRRAFKVNASSVGSKR